ncbi:MAG TPA: nucleoside triphosphate pyrophosphatase [Candidatus Binataceae bacterium]
MDINQKQPAERVILASGSPRRRELLARAGLNVEVRESGISEELREGEDALEFASRLASEKAVAVSNRKREPLVIGADTVVNCDGIMGKPRDPEEARAMLKRLSGRTHTVVTAFALARAGKIIESDAVSSRVTFRELTDSEIADYIATGAPMDKAGAYGIQDAGAGFISTVQGQRDNVMGLPVEQVLAAIVRCRSRIARRRF